MNKCDRFLEEAAGRFGDYLKVTNFFEINRVDKNWDFWFIVFGKNLYRGYISVVVYFQWMYPFERNMKVLKGFFRNHNRLEGCIAENYVAEEDI